MSFDSLVTPNVAFTNVRTVYAYKQKRRLREEGRCETQTQLVPPSQILRSHEKPEKLFESEFVQFLVCVFLPFSRFGSSCVEGGIFMNFKFSSLVPASTCPRY